jgi:REP element-mobilizing transposase RayT
METDTWKEIEHIARSHSYTLILYHIVFVAKYRRKVLTESVQKTLVQSCLDLQESYDYIFHEIGMEGDHVHFLLQSIPRLSPSNIVQAIKSITTKTILKIHPEVTIIIRKRQLWTDAYYLSTVWLHWNQDTIRRYIQNQGKPQEYKRMHISESQLQMQF